MNDKIVNPSIGCNVSQCKYHCGSKQYCSLDKISVAKQVENVNTPKETVCGSFECGSGGHGCGGCQ